MNSGLVIGIFVTAEKSQPMQALTSANAKAGLGLEGDRYCGLSGTIKKGVRHVTLIEIEAIEGACRDYKLELAAHETRRNLLTRGVALNHLVGKAFSVGAVQMRGVEMCEPCGYLERVSGKKIRESLVHRGGIRAEILTDGTIETGSVIVEASQIGD